jgi:hypothetical protein
LIYSILNIDIQGFIKNNKDSDISTLLLKGIPFKDVNANELIEQIEARKKSEFKLPKWFNTDNIYYPNKLNIEQTSSEITARYKSNLMYGNTIIDITGGFGVDCFYFSKQFENVTYCEIDESLSEIVNYNNKILGVENIETLNTDGVTYLNTSKKQFDWIYADPSRRHDSKGKVFFLHDCLPNIPENLDILFDYSNNIMIKTSPLLDISIGIDELKYVKRIHIIAVNNEVKELLWILKKGYKSKISIKTVNLKKRSQEHFDFLLNNEESSKTKYSLPLTYLYEPNSAILKAGAFNIVANKFKLYKFHKHSHLYTNNELIKFPGRRFKIIKVIPFNKKSIKHEEITKANITTRNFPVTVQSIRKKFKIKDGGSLYLLFTTNKVNEKIVLLTHKIPNEAFN